MIDLDKINNPQSLKKLQPEELKSACKSIRERIIDVVSKKDGHLASSLGAVELCVALHYVLDTPKDKLVFDVGHQAYAHKLITNRFKEFESIRQLGGISGFPYHKESVYDTFSVGHASNAISLALGLACANRLIGDKSKVVALIGDGSLSGGECFEALNHAGHLKEDLLVIFNHNEMSISPSVGAIGNYLNKILSLPIYNRIRESVNLFLKKVPGVGKPVLRHFNKIEEILKGMIVPGIFFEELGFRYFGPLDGHNLDVIVPAIRNIVGLAGPKILHVVTKKGKGYAPAEENPELFHSAKKFCKQTGQISSSACASYTDVFGNTLLNLARHDNNIVALTAAMCGGTGLRRFKETFPNRFFDVGIAEQHLVSLAAGLSKRYIKPIVAVYSTFLQRAYDQLIEDVALQDLPVTFVIDRAGLVGQDGPTHHGIFDLNYLRSIPNFIIIAPGYEADLQQALRFSLKADKPVAIRYAKEEAFSMPPKEKFAFAKSEVIREGKDFAVLALGSMLKNAVKVCDLFAKEAVSVHLINPRFVKPLDTEMLLSLAERFNFIVTLEEGILGGGFGTAVLEFYSEAKKINKPRVERLGLPCDFITFGKREELLRVYELDPEGIYNKIKQILNS